LSLFQFIYQRNNAFQTIAYIAMRSWMSETIADASDKFHTGLRGNIEFFMDLKIRKSFSANDRVFCIRR